MKVNRQIPQDIAKLAEIIRKYDFTSIIEPYPLEQAASNWKEWNKFDISDLTFTISCSKQKPIPNNINRIAIVLDINYIYGNLEEECDVFQNYQLNLCIKGYKLGTNSESKFFSWHLDKEENTDASFIHPLYHFHAGGKRLKGKIGKDSENFVISSPRLAHPPMDIILAIHFIIQNFVNGSEVKEKEQLIHDHDYCEIVSRAQQRVLDPYFGAFSKQSKHKDYSRENLFPLYL